MNLYVRLKIVFIVDIRKDHKNAEINWSLNASNHQDLADRTGLVFKWLEYSDVI